MSTVVITGATGFVARGSAAALIDAGFTTTGIIRREAFECAGYSHLVRRSFGQPLGAVLKGPPELMLHTAADLHDHVLTRTGTLAWASEAERAGVAHQIFVSSISAVLAQRNPYGLEKRMTEAWFLERGHVVLRPGLIIGRGGLFGAMLEKLSRWPIIPLIDGGKHCVHVTGLDFLVQVVVAIAQAPDAHRGAAYNLNHTTRLPLRQLLELSGSIVGVRPHFVRIPFAAIYAPLLALERLPLPMPVRTENLLGLRENSAALRSDAHQFEGGNRSPEEVVARNLRATAAQIPIS